MTDWRERAIELFGYEDGALIETAAALAAEAEAKGKESAAMSDSDWMKHCEAASKQARAEGREAGLEEAAQIVDDHEWLPHLPVDKLKDCLLNCAARIRKAKTGAGDL